MTQPQLFVPQPPESAPDLARKASVLVPFPVDKAYSYALAEGIGAQPGDYVIVPLGGREVPGVVWDDVPDDVKSGKLKGIVHKYDFPPMPEIERRFIDWLANYTMTPRGAVLKMALSVPGALEPPKTAQGYIRGAQLSDATFKGLSPQRKSVLEALADGMPRRASEIAETAGCTPGVIKTMAGQGLLTPVDIFSHAPCRHPDFERPRASLSPTQATAADVLCRYVQDGAYHAALLDGVTGAGKTEVYFEAVAEVLKTGRQALLLLPEIALSNAFLERFKARFGCAPALWHSSLGPAQRRNTWRGVAEGQTKVVVGARSALFLPYHDLGLIIVDEEHDPAYKQDEGVIYNARDMAIVRAHMGKIPVVLVSATPSLETMANVWTGKYAHLQLPDRHAGASLPAMHVIDMKIDKPERQKFISPALMKAVVDTVAAGEQALLFLNRRGYAPLTLCRTCGHRMECPRCTAWLVEHKNSGKLQCHHCGYAMRQPKECPSCNDTDSFAACGPGVERILEEVKEGFPQARTIVLASDTATTHDELKAILDRIRHHEVDVIVGTQIIAKGHHFPNLTCVGVIDADLGLQGGDLRAAERTFQLLHQVAGRAGREEKPGHVWLQTWLPRNKVMMALSQHDRDRFLDIEMQEREAAHMPPVSRLAGIIVSGKNERQVEEVARELGKIAPQAENISTLGPAPAPFYRLRGNFRRRLLVRADKSVNIQKAITDWLGAFKTPSAVRIQIDIDPQSFM
ncbi:MAG: primosomal protein N' [Micavibrio aeruginosavorus]|uniref:Replication restart protein PriA n=1 Tax=Micavibrio aeruginosavorus TaxID=349221 RepID=A0A7T5R3V2_9BACT|nr:MAG: primosomal protein N' [Micavibrio aeruginosavorus]